MPYSSPPHPDIFFLPSHPPSHRTGSIGSRGASARGWEAARRPCWLVGSKWLWPIRQAPFGPIRLAPCLPVLVHPKCKDRHRATKRRRSKLPVSFSPYPHSIPNFSTDPRCAVHNPTNHRTGGRLHRKVKRRAAAAAAAAGATARRRRDPPAGGLGLGRRRGGRVTSGGQQQPGAVP